MQRKLKIIIEYDGTRYHGWQIQPNGITIQEVLQKILHIITKEKITLFASGRTDAGVHAEGQVAHFSSSARMTCKEFLMAFNSLLPSDIVIKKVEEVADDFHAQYSAIRKSYRYTILNRDHPSALEHRQSYYTQFPLNVDDMRQAALCLVGLHDFSAFRARNCSGRSPIKELFRVDVIQEPGGIIQIHVDGSGFLKYMVRIMVGTLLLVGHGRIAATEVETILLSRDRQKAGPTAESHGLCLVHVVYPD
jgi:tRNA pseudouridine38-40 synthase